MTDETQERAARFQDYGSTARGTLCLLFADNGEGLCLGSVWATNDGQWVWETQDATEDEGTGTEDSRREAKRALRKYLKHGHDEPNGGAS